MSAFGSRTGRNQPGNGRSIFGSSAWLRSLIRPAPGMGVVYSDWSQQGLAIAATLSGGTKTQSAYQSGDFYRTVAEMAGAVPPEATKDTHAAVRKQFKTVALGVLLPDRPPAKGLSQINPFPTINAHRRRLKPTPFRRPNPFPPTVPAVPEVVPQRFIQKLGHPRTTPG